MSTSRALYVSFLSLVAMWCGLLVLAPLSRLGGFPPEVSSMLYGFFSHVCHQIRERSFFIGGEPLGVCIRCSSIYFAFLGATLLYPLVRRIDTPMTPPRWVLVTALVPMAFDVVAGLTGIHQASTVTRIVTGALAGGVLPFFLLPLLCTAIRHFLTVRGDFVHVREAK